MFLAVGFALFRETVQTGPSLRHWEDNVCCKPPLTLTYQFERCHGSGQSIIGTVTILQRTKQCISLLKVRPHVVQGA